MANLVLYDWVADWFSRAGSRWLDITASLFVMAQNAGLLGLASPRAC
jgi:hypothetical protein